MSAAMLQTFQRAQARLGTPTLALLALLALLAHLGATEWLNASYAASRFPVPYHVAQLSFDAARLKAWYATLQGLGTLPLYLHTQHVDFAFIASVLALHPLVLLLVARALPAGGRWQQALVALAALSAVAPLADALENGISYVMLANPQGFAPWLAQAYSSAAALKFAAFTLAYAAAAVGLLAAAVLRLQRGRGLNGRSRRPALGRGCVRHAGRARSWP